MNNTFNVGVSNPVYGLGAEEDAGLHEISPCSSEDRSGPASVRPFPPFHLGIHEEAGPVAVDPG